MKYKMKILLPILFSVFIFSLVSPDMPVHASEKGTITTNCQMFSGETTNTDIAIENTDPVAHTYTLAYQPLPTDFYGCFKQNNSVVTTITVPASASGIVTFSIDVPIDSKTKSLAVPLIFTKDDGSADTFTITYTLNQDYAVAISNNVSLLKAMNGETITLDIGVTNTGTKDLTDLALTIDAPYKWITESVTPQTLNLKKGESGLYKVSIITPASGQSGTYPIKITCSNDLIASTELSVPVQVSTSANYFWLIAGIISALLVFTLFFFKKNGRR